MGWDIMTCDYFTYRDMTEKLFYGVALTDAQLNYATEQIRQYLINGGAVDIIKKMGIGIKIVEKQYFLPELNEIIKKRFVFTDGERKGEELTIIEIQSIGMFLRHGAFYNKI